MLNRKLVEEFMDTFCCQGGLTVENLDKLGRYHRAVDFLEQRGEEIGESNPEVAYAEIRRVGVNAENYKLRSDLSIFMNWYTIQLEHIDSTTEGSYVQAQRG